MHYEKFADGSVKCIEDKIPFDLPENWAWVRLQSFCTMSNGTAKRNGADGTHTTVLRLADLGEDDIFYSGTRSVILTDEEIAKYSLSDGDILFIRVNGSKENVGKSYFFEGQPFPVAYCDHLIRCTPSTVLRGKLLSMFMRCGYVRQLIGERMVSAAGQNTISQPSLGTILLPIPPHHEQDRILQKLTLAEGFIEQLCEAKHELVKITERAKAKILDLAIHGQLVPQDPADEPASVLLDRIRKEKENLIKQGKIKRDKKETIIFRGDDNSYYLKQGDHVEAVDSQFLFDLPDGWSWCLLPNISHSELGKTLDQAKNTGDLHPYLRSVNIRWDEVDLSDVNQMRFEPEEMDRYTITKGDLLICEGGDVGRSAIWISDNDILYQNALHRVRFWGGINPRFFMYYMMFYESKGIIKDICKGVTIKHLTGNVLNSIPFALPPVDEQIAIVAKIDEAFKLLNTIL